MAIGVNWAEIWVEAVWDPVWTQTPPEPPVPDETPVITPAGRHKRHRYFIEIDGQQFLVDDVTQARQLLDRARAIAEQQAEKKAISAEKKLKRKPVVPRVRVEPPVIKVAPELRAELMPMVDDIKRLYVKAAELVELRLLMLKAQQDEEDEEDLLLLL